MKYALITLIAVLLLAGEGCVWNAYSVRPIDEAKCMASAKEWVKEAEGYVGELLKNIDGRESIELFRTAEAFERLNRLAILQAKTGDKEAAVKTFDLAMKLAPTAHRCMSGCRNPYGSALCAIATAQAKAGFYDLAQKTASSISKNHYDRHKAFTSIQWIAVKAGEWDVAKSMCPNGDYDIALCEAEAGRFEDAKKTAALMLSNETNRGVYMLVMIARLEADAGRSDEAKKTLAWAEENLPANKTRNGFDAVVLQVEVVLGMYEAAEARLAKITNDSRKFWPLISIAEARFKSGDKKSAEALLAQAEEIALKTQSVDQRITWLCHIAIAEANMLGKSSALKIFNEAWIAVPEHYREDARVACFVKITEAKAKAGLHAEAREDAKKIGDNGTKRSVFRPIARIQADAGLYEQAEETFEYASKLGRWCSKDSFLRMIMHAQVRAGKLEQAYATIRSISKPLQSDIVTIINAKLDAGETRHLGKLIGMLEKCALSYNRRHVAFAGIYARVGYEKQLYVVYEAIKERPVDERINFCLGAARGYLKRIEDKKTYEVKTQ